MLMKLKLAKLMDLRVGTETVENEAIKWQMQEDQSLGTKLTGGMRGDEEVLPQETNVRDSRGSIPSRKSKSKGKKNKRWARRSVKKVMDLMKIKLDQVKVKEKEARREYKAEKVRLKRVQYEKEREKV